MKRLSIIAGLAICLSSVAVAAQPSGPYVGVLGGSVESRQQSTRVILELNEAGEDIVVGSVPMTLKDDRSAYGAVLGWQLNRSLAFETSYLRANTISNTFDDATTTKYRVNAWTATALYTLPLSRRWSAHARLGGIRRMNELAVRYQGITPVTYSGRGDSLLYGAGLGMSLDKLQLRFDLQSAKMHSQRTTVISLGANWHLQ
jgi:opacity protein-like surface antigen